MELLRHSPEIVVEVLLGSNVPPPDLQGFPSPIYHLAKSCFRQLDIFGTNAPLFVCRLPSLTGYDLSSPPKGLEMLCPMGDPGNLGSLLRGCWIFGVERVILLNESVHPFHPKVIRASSGAVFSLVLHRGCSMGELVRPEIARWITALDMVGDNLNTWDWPKNTRLLIGEEGMGLPPASFANRLNILQARKTIPLNASVAGHIALYTYRQTHPFSLSRRIDP